MPNDEQQFQAWYAQEAQRSGLNPDPSGQFYDYRAAFRAGAKPDASGHWPSDYKQAGHPDEIVGGFNTRTGERVPGTPQASESELVRLGWDAATAKKFSTTQGAGVDELDQIIDKAIADGLKDEDIQFIVGEWKGDHPPTPSPGAQARQQSNERPAEYLREMASNALPDAWRTGKDMVRGAAGAVGTLARATGEVGSAVGSAVRDVVGLEPNYGGTENIEAVAGAVPAMIQHYGQYLDPNQRALMVRDRPIGMVADMVGLTSLRGPVKSAASKAVGVVKRNPGLAADAAGAVVGGAMGGPGGAVLGVAKRRAMSGMLDWLKGGKSAAPAGPSVADEAAEALRASTNVEAPARPMTQGGRGAAPVAQESVESQLLPQSAVEQRASIAAMEQLPQRSALEVGGGNRQPLVAPGPTLESTLLSDAALEHRVGLAGREAMSPQVTAPEIGGRAVPPMTRQYPGIIAPGVKAMQARGPAPKLTPGSVVSKVRATPRPAPEAPAPAPKTGEAFLDDLLNQDVERRHALIEQERAAGTWDRDPTPAPAPAKPALPVGSKSKGATRMSANDMDVFTEAVTAGKSAPEALEEMLTQRAARHAQKYGAAKDAAAAKKTGGAIEKLAQQLNDVMK